MKDVNVTENQLYKQAQQVTPESFYRKAALQSFDFFREEYLGHASYEAQKDWTNLIEHHNRVLTLCPGEHGKSMEAVDYITWLVVLNRFQKVLGRDIGELNCIIVSNAADLGEKWIMQIKHYLQSPKIVRDFGSFKNSKKWSAYSILVTSPNRNARVDHPTVQAVGIGGQVFGLRADFVIADDIVDKENSSTPEQRKKLWELFAEGVSAWLRPHGKIWVIGTRMHSKDLYAEIIKKGVYEVLIQKAVDFETGKVLCPEKYNLAYFKMKKKEMGTTSFNRRFMNLALDEADAAFFEEWFAHLYDERRPYGLVPAGHHVDIGVDPAVGKGRGRSHIGICAIGYNPREPEKRLLIDYISDQITPEAQADNILQWYVRYNASLIRIEKNACQLYLKSYLLERAARIGANPRIEMTYTGSQKWDIGYGVNVVSAAFENGSFRLPYADSAKDKTHRLKDILIESAADKPPDIVMAMWFIEQKFNELLKRRSSRIKLNQPGYLRVVPSRRIV